MAEEKRKRGNPNLVKGGAALNPNGRPKGSRNKRSVEDDKLLEAVTTKKGWKTPLEIMLEIANDPASSKSMKLAASSAAAPYVHSKKAAELAQPAMGSPAEYAAAVREQLAALTTTAPASNPAGSDELVTEEED